MTELSQCGLIEILDGSQSPHPHDEFLRGYLMYQKNFAGGELGAEVDERQSVIEDVCEVLDLAGIDEYTDTALAAISCIKARYMGECTQIQCSGRDRDIISEVSVTVG